MQAKKNPYALKLFDKIKIIATANPDFDTVKIKGIKVIIASLFCPESQYNQNKKDNMTPQTHSLKSGVINL